MKKDKEKTFPKRFIEPSRDLVTDINSANEGNAIEEGMFLQGKHLEETPERTRTVRFMRCSECKCCNKPIDKGGHYCPPCAMGKCKHN